MHNKLDLNLLIVAASLYRNKNVTKSAQELGLSQSAVSHALSRLRDHYSDPLFVRVSKGISPTEFAKEIQAEVMEFASKSNSLSQKNTSFDPANAKGRVTLVTTDYFEIVVIPKLLATIRKEAPHIQISLRPAVGELPKQMLESGGCDFAVAGFFKELPEGFYKAKLFDDDFSTAFRKGHPKSGNFSKKDFHEGNHALITLQGDFDDDLERKITYGTSSFTGPAWVVSNTDLLLTAPTLLLNQYQRYFPVQIVKCPVKIDPIKIEMVWHALTNQDPLKKWVRNCIKKVCAEL